MKLKGFFHCLILTLTVGVATFTNATFNKEKDIIATEAANITAGTKFYLKPNSNWTQANARFAAYFFGNGEAWVSMTSVTNQSGVYECNSPSDKYYKNVIFCRMNPSNATNNWDNRWNQTGNLEFDGTNNCFTLNDGSWDSGTWSFVSYFKQNTELYVDFNASWNGGGAILSVYNFNGAANKWLTTTQVDGSSIYKFIVGLDNSALILVRSNPSNPNSWGDGHKWNQSADIYASATSGANYFKATGFSSDSKSTLTFEFDSNLTYSNVESWAEGLVGTGVCDPDGVNSTYNWSKLETTFNALTDPEKHLLVTATANENGSDVQHALATYDYLVDEKKLSAFIIEGSTVRSSNSISFFNNRNNNQTILTFMVVTIAIVSIVGVMVYKKRKSISE